MTKADKDMGLEHIRVQRRKEAVPERPTPKAVANKQRKRFGFQCEVKRLWSLGETTHRQWFLTEKARDQALHHVQTNGNTYYDVLKARNFQKIER